MIGYGGLLYPIFLFVVTVVENCLRILSECTISRREK